MATQDLTTYAETDISSDITITADRATVTTMEVQAEAHVSLDGTDTSAWDGDFDIDFTAYFDSGGTNLAKWFYCTVANILDTQQAIDDASGDMLACEPFYLGNPGRMYLVEIDAGTFNSSDYWDFHTATVWYCTFERDESVGTYGTIYLRVYSDSARTSEDHDSPKSLTLTTSKKDFRYFYAVQSAQGTGNKAASGYIEDITFNVGGPGGGPATGQPMARRWGGIPGMDIGGRMNW